MSEGAQRWDMPAIFQQNPSSSAGSSYKYKRGASGRGEAEKIVQGSRL